MRLPRTLAPTEIRVLGSLLEKQQATPEYYPLTLGAVVAACNQKSNREPVLELSGPDILGALESLREMVLVWKVTGSRADKWEENLSAKLDLAPAAKAILTLLFLRGPQTPGELKGRSDRLHPFANLGEVEAALSALSAGADPLVAVLPRRPGQKETRWAHLLSDEALTDEVTPTEMGTSLPLSDRVAQLEKQQAALAAELADLRKRLGEG